MKKLLILMGLLAVCAGAGAQEWAVVNTSSVFMRETPSYTSENVSQSRMGTPVQVLGRSGYWVKIRTPEPYEGWVNELTLAPLPEGYETLDRYICVREHGFVYAEPAPDAPRLSDLLMSDILRKGEDARSVPGMTREEQGRTTETEGWVPVRLWDGRSGWVPEADVADFAEWMSDAGRRAEKAASADETAEELAVEIVARARLFLGAPYMWGGMSAGLFDCSGLVGFCYFMSGIQLPRDASQQILHGIPVEFEDMRAGDLVFFGDKRVGHVALCTGPGRIIHSSQIVRENSLIKGEPDYYGRNILGIRRYLGHCSGEDLVKNSPLYFGK